MAYEGSLSIMYGHQTQTSPAGYGISFTTNQRGGGSIGIYWCYDEGRGLDAALVDFLKGLEIHREHIDKALNELHENGSPDPRRTAHVGNVFLTREQIDHYGF